MRGLHTYKGELSEDDDVDFYSTLLGDKSTITTHSRKCPLLGVSGWNIDTYRLQGPSSHED